MTNHFYNKETLEYTKSRVAELDVRETQIKGEDFFLRLPNCTQKEPLKRSKGKAVVFDKVIGNWKYVKDLRGKKFYLPDDSTEYVITEAGVDLPENALENEENHLLRPSAWGDMEDLRDRKIKEPVEHSSKMYKVIPSSIESMKDVVEELSDGDTVQWKTVEKEVVTLSYSDIKSILTKFRLRKQMLFSASWLVEAVINNSLEVKSLNLAELYDAKILEVQSA